MDRLDINTLYGGKSESLLQPTKKKVHMYTPKDTDSETSNSLSKMFKINREMGVENKSLKKENDKLNKELQQEKLKNDNLRKKLNIQ
jgi:hypothetical protein